MNFSFSHFSVARLCLINVRPPGGTFWNHFWTHFEDLKTIKKRKATQGGKGTLTGGEYDLWPYHFGSLEPSVGGKGGI